MEINGEITRITPGKRGVTTLIIKTKELTPKQCNEIADKDYCPQVKMTVAL